MLENVKTIFWIIGYFIRIIMFVFYSIFLNGKYIFKGVFKGIKTFGDMEEIFKQLDEEYDKKIDRMAYKLLGVDANQYQK